MIATIIEVLDIIADGRLSAPTRYGLAELKPIGEGSAPAVYVSGGSWTNITVDSGGNWSYWRLTEKVKEYPDTRTAACLLLTQEQSLRLVTLVDREVCDNLPDIARASASDMRRGSQGVRAAIPGSIVEISVTGIDTDTERVFASEFKGIGQGVNTNKALVAIDLVVKVTASEQCFDACGSPVDLTCRIIDVASNAKVVDCLGPTRVEEICNTDCPTMCEQVAEADGAEVVECIADDQMNLALCAAIARPESTADIIVECIGNADKTDGVRALICVACDDATVELNGVEVATVAAGDTVDIPVLQGGSPVGSWNGTQWIIPACPSGSTGNYWRAIALGT
jgi:hypothetical protein